MVLSIYILHPIFIFESMAILSCTFVYKLEMAIACSSVDDNAIANSRMMDVFGAPAAINVSNIGRRPYSEINVFVPFLVNAIYE